VDDEERKRIEKHILGSKLSRFKKSFLSEFYFVEKNHGSIYNRFMWISFLGIILGMAYVIGNASAIGVFPLGEWDAESNEFENFKIDSLLKNLNRSGNLLIIETEWMQYDFTIYNNYEKDVVFKVYTRVSNSGENTYSDIVTEVSVPKGESNNIVKKFPLKNEGINSVSIIFEMYEVYESGISKGKANLLKEIGSESISKSFRAFSYTDFNALYEQSIIYKLLWIVIAPFAAITIKHIRDLVEGR